MAVVQYVVIARPFDTVRYEKKSSLPRHFTYPVFAIYARDAGGRDVTFSRWHTLTRRKGFRA